MAATGVGEDRQHPVAGRLDHAAAMRVDARAQEPIMLGERRAHRSCVLFPETRAPLDVREQEGRDAAQDVGGVGRRRRDRPDRRRRGPGRGGGRHPAMLLPRGAAIDGRGRGRQPSNPGVPPPPRGRGPAPSTSTRQSATPSASWNWRGVIPSVMPRTYRPGRSSGKSRGLSPAADSAVTRRAAMAHHA